MNEKRAKWWKRAGLLCALAGVAVVLSGCHVHSHYHGDRHYYGHHGHKHWKSGHHDGRHYRWHR